MTYCLNPDCPKPRNPQTAKVCRSCGAKLHLKDRYRAIAAIGQGGFGRTFLAIDEDKPSRPRCVIKQFLPIAQDPRSLKKAANLFAQEAVRLEELGHHPQIPELLAYFNQEGQQYLIQEFIDGRNLADRVVEQGPFSEAQVRQVLTSLLPVLDFVHSHKVIHRDIKPGNLISPTGLAGRRSFPQPGQPDWTGLQQALATEIAQGFRNFSTSTYRFSEVISLSLAYPPRDLTIALYQRTQQLAMQFARYASLPPLQRQYLVTEATRLLAEIRQLYGTNSAQTSLGRLVLVDFGAAKSVKGLEFLQTGTKIGSPEYAAPEQARGKAVFSSDLYGLGVTCIHLLTQRSPYDLFDSHHNSWVWRNYLPTPISDSLGHILDRLLEAAIPRRYQSAAEVLQDLEATAIASPAAAVAVSPLNLQAASPVPPISLQAAVPQPLVAHRQRNGSLEAFPQPSFQIAPRPRLPFPEDVEPIAPSITEESPLPEPPLRSGWQCLHSVESPGRVYAIATSSTDPLLVSSSGNALKLWDRETLQPLRTLTGHLDIIPALVVSADGKLLVSGSADKTISLWELPLGRRLSTLAVHADTVLALAISANGQLLASSSFYDPITIWDLHNRQKRHGLLGHSARIDALAFSPNGEILASGSGDRTIKLWNVDTGEEIRTLEGHTNQITDLAFSPDGNTLVSSSWDGTVRFWNLKTRRPGRILDLESGRVNAIAFSSDGKKLAIASNTLQVWTLPGKKVIVFSKPTESVVDVAFGPEDHLLFSAHSDRAIKVWKWQEKVRKN